MVTLFDCTNTAAVIRNSKHLKVGLKDSRRVESLRRVLTKPILSYFDSVSESVVAMFLSFALGHSLPVNILLEIHTPVSKALFAEAFGAASFIV